MEKQKPYLTFSFPPPGAKTLLFKKGAQKNAEFLRQKTIEEHREAQEDLAKVRLLPPGLLVEPVCCGGVPCEWVQKPEGAPGKKVICYIHGGSWAYGSLNSARPPAAMLSEVTGYPVLVADYRLAPESPFPAAGDDCLAVYRWLLEQGREAREIALFGDSAGGNLALSLIHRLKAEGIPLPAALGLASPCTDMSGDSFLWKNMPDILYTQYNGEERDVFSLYCGEHDRWDPLISPYHGDLAGFPPMLIHVGQDEELCIDCDLFAAKAHEAGAEVSLKIWRELFHDFSIVGVTLKESRQSMLEFGAFITQHLEADA